MLKIIDYILYKIVEFFKRRNLFIVWYISYWVISYGFYRYELYNNYDVRLYWYDAVTIILFISTYLRAKLIVAELNEYEKENK